jgi:hypothetical protein
LFFFNFTRRASNFVCKPGKSFAGEEVLDGKGCAEGCVAPDVDTVTDGDAPVDAGRTGGVIAGALKGGVVVDRAF